MTFLFYKLMNKTHFKQTPELNCCINALNVKLHERLSTEMLSEMAANDAFLCFYTSTAFGKTNFQCVFVH